MPRSNLIIAIQLIHRRRARRERRRATLASKALLNATVLLAVVSVVAAMVAVAATPFYTYLSYDLPRVEELELLLDPQTGLLLQPTRLFDRSGQEILAFLEPANAGRVFIQASDNPLLAAAFIASTDPEFLDHQGFSLSNLTGRPTTLAESLAANLLLADEPEGWLKNVRAKLLANFATQRYGRQQILTWALNSAVFAHWTFGVESAAQLYFGKPAAELSLAESALLAAVGQAPALNPIDAPELAIEYQRLVLVAMRDQGMIDEQQFAIALTEELQFAPAPPDNSLAPDFTNLVVSQLEEQMGKNLLERGALEIVTTLDLDLQQQIHFQLTEQSSQALVINPSNGQILALSGDGRQTHDTAAATTPFVYVSAFAQGFSPASLVWDLPSSSNFEVDIYHGPVSVRQAFANSYIGVEAYLRNTIGAEKIEETFSAFGLPSDEMLSLIEIGNAYGILANSGIHSGQIQDNALEPSAVLFVHDREKLMLDWSQAQISAVTSPELAYLVTDVLADASVRESVSLDTASFSRPSAIKTGVASNGTWFVAYSPQRVVVIWAGDEVKANALGRFTFEAAHLDLPIQNWDVPGGLTSHTVCVPSGQLVDEDCPQSRREFFLAANQPVDSDSLFRRIAINQLTGKLATVFTPKEFVEEQLLMEIPVRAESWAEVAAIERIPDEYDKIPALDIEDAMVRILEPNLFDSVSGQVSIFGRSTLDVAGFDVQVGQGLYPNEWLMIADGTRIPQNGKLAEWDTTGLSGLYAIQLQVLDAEGNLFRTYTLVTLSN